MQALERRDPQRRYPILLTVLAQSGTDVLDEVVQLFDQAISARESKAARAMLEALAERGKAGEGRQGLLDELLAIIFDMALDDEQIGGLIRGDGGTVSEKRSQLRYPLCRVIMGISRLWMVRTDICVSSPRSSSLQSNSPVVRPRLGCWKRFRSCGI